MGETPALDPAFPFVKSPGLRVQIASKSAITTSQPCVRLIHVAYSRKRLAVSEKEPLGVDEAGGVVFIYLGKLSPTRIR